MQFSFGSKRTPYSRNKISLITDISVLGFYGYIRKSVNIDGYFDKNIGKAKINKNT